MVATTVRIAFAQPHPTSTCDQLRLVADMLIERQSTVSDLVLKPEEDATGFAPIPLGPMEEDLDPLIGSCGRSKDKPTS